MRSHVETSIVTTSAADSSMISLVRIFIGYADAQRGPTGHANPLIYCARSARSLAAPLKPKTKSPSPRLRRGAFCRTARRLLLGLGRLLGLGLGRAFAGRLVALLGAL